MQNRKLYQRKAKAQLVQWRADLDKLKARAVGASADRQLEINRNLKVLERKIEEGRSKLSEISRYGEDSWESAGKTVRSAWESIKFEANDVVAKLKR